MKKLLFTAFLLSSVYAFGQSVTIMPNQTTNRAFTGTNLLIRANAPDLGVFGQRFNGTITSPTPVLNGNDLFRVSGGGSYSSTSYSNNGSMRFNATENWGATNSGTKISFWTTPNGTYDQAERMVIDHNGNVGINQPNTYHKFEVVGTGNTVNNWNDYNRPSRIAISGNGIHSTVNDNYDAIGVAGFGTNANALNGKNNIGVLGTTSNNGGVNIGVLGYQLANASSISPSTIGVKGEVVQTAINIAYGVNGKVTTINSSTGYGVYGEAYGTGTNYAGYFAGNVAVNGYTQLGESSPKIKFKKFTGTTDAAQGGFANIAHGLNMDKILDVQVIIKPTSAYRHPHAWRANPGFEYDFFIDATNVSVLNVFGNSNFILGKPFTILIIYEE